MGNLQSYVLEVTTRVRVGAESPDEARTQFEHYGGETLSSEIVSVEPAAATPEEALRQLKEQTWHDVRAAWPDADADEVDEVDLPDYVVLFELFDGQGSEYVLQPADLGPLGSSPRA